MKRNLLSSFLAVGFFLSVALVSLLPTSTMALDTVLLVHPELLGGKVIRDQQYRANGQKGWHTLYSYNNRGQLVKKESYNSTGEKRRSSLFSYDGQGRLMRRQPEQGFGNIYFLYIYNDQGQLVKIQQRIPHIGGFLIQGRLLEGGEIEEMGFALCSYNDRGQLAKIQWYVSTFSDKWKDLLYSYNDQGQVVKGQYYDHYNEIGWYWLYSYNDRGRLVKQQFYGPSGEKRSHWLYTVESPLEFKCRELDDIAACEELAK